MEAEIDALQAQLPDELPETAHPKTSAKRRQRGFSATLLRERIELILSDEEKAGASKVFFTKVKEELQFIPSANVPSPRPCWAMSLPQNMPMACRCTACSRCSGAWGWT